MNHLVYLHGFLSAPASKKAVQTKQWLALNYPDWQYHCPQLSSYPNQAMREIRHLADRLPAENTFVIGSSLGGFWATWMVESGLASKAILVNPAVAPHTRFHEFVGRSLKSYYTDDVYQLTDDHLKVLAACDQPAITPEKYWLMVQTGDETLDYRQALQRYHTAKVTCEEGGNHSFEGYTQWLPKLLPFFEGP